jgi:NADPH:quinone reductase-like Zn-dependent oxidoreductase
MLYRKDPQPLLEDLPKIFALLTENKIDPMVSRTFPLLDAREALEFLAAGSVEGKIVLTTDPHGSLAGRLSTD